MTRMLKPIIFYSGGTDPDVDVRDFRPANSGPKPQIDTPVAVGIELEVESETDAGEAGPKASSAQESASTSTEENNGDSTPQVPTSAHPSQSGASVTPAPAVKEEIKPPLLKPGKPAPPASATPLAPSKPE